ncbi:MAG TPA: FAD binding domain-containing protein [Acidimicrobiia bacterium]|nr:FAD binding domain-containing protein [Acidimicrobiia bacterium]
MKPAPFEYVRPATVGEALGALTGDEGAKLIAGGQSLVPLMALRLARPTVLVDVKDLELDLVGTDAGQVRIGAATPHRRLEHDPVIAHAAPIVREAAGLIGYPAIRTRGTIGGSIAHADPVAELPALLVAAQGSVVARSTRGTREISACDLFAGFLETTLARDELIEEIRLPAAGARHGSSFCEWAPRAGDFAVVGVALLVERAADGPCERIGAAACGIGSVPLDCTEAVERARGENNPTGSLLRDVAARARALVTGDDDRAELLALLMARALSRSFARSDRPREAAA